MGFAYISVWIAPKSRLKSEISAMIRAFSHKYKTYKSIKEWKGPHITLMILELRGYEEDKFWEVVDDLKKNIGNTRPFRIDIDGIGYFRKPNAEGRINYVIYLKPLRNDALRKLWFAMSRKFIKYDITRHKKFSPHLTLAYDDLKKKEFYKALKDYTDFKFSRSFLVGEVIVSSEVGKERRRIKTIIKLRS